VHQLLIQFPTAFEFNMELLHQIAYHIYSAAFGNLILRNEKERLEAKCRQKTISFWSYVLEYSNRFTNERFAADKRMLFPRTRERDLRIWREQFVTLDCVLGLDPYQNTVNRDLRQGSLYEESLLQEISRLKQENLNLRKDFLDQAQGSSPKIKPPAFKVEAINVMEDVTKTPQELDFIERKPEIDKMEGLKVEDDQKGSESQNTEVNIKKIETLKGFFGSDAF
jgi:hypothetical protein